MVFLANVANIENILYMSRKKFGNGDAPQWGIPTPAQNYDYGGMGQLPCTDGAHYETVQCTVSTATSGNDHRNHRHQREWRRTTMGHTDTRTKL